MKKRKLRKWVKVAIAIMVVLIALSIKAKLDDLKQIRVPEYKYTIQEIKRQEEPKNVVIEEVARDYRLTYYFTGDNTNSTDITASGIKTSQFETNENGWYTYKGKLVVATASKRLLSWDKYKNSTQRLFNLYDELTLEINGTKYEAIVLDVCGACMQSEKIDLFVKDRLSGIDTKIKLFE